MKKKDIEIIEHYLGYYSEEYIFRKKVEKLIKSYKKLEKKEHKELEKFIKRELKMIEKNRGKLDDKVLDGMKAAYECTLNLFVNN